MAKKKQLKHSNKKISQHEKYEDDQGTLARQIFLLSRNTE